jgi:hypothetical protein
MDWVPRFRAWWWENPRTKIFYSVFLNRRPGRVARCDGAPSTGIGGGMQELRSTKGNFALAGLPGRPHSEVASSAP